MTQLQTYEAACQPSDLATIRKWLNRLSFAVSNAPDEQSGAARYAAIASACNDLPAGVWTEETLLKAMRTFKFWPSAAELYDLLKPIADRLTATRDYLSKPIAIAVASRTPYVLPMPPTERQIHVNPPVIAVAPVRTPEQQVAAILATTSSVEFEQSHRAADIRRQTGPQPIAGTERDEPEDKRHQHSVRKLIEQMQAAVRKPVP